MQNLQGKPKKLLFFLLPVLSRSVLGSPSPIRFPGKFILVWLPRRGKKKVGILTADCNCDGSQEHLGDEFWNSYQFMYDSFFLAHARCFNIKIDFIFFFFFWTSTIKQLVSCVLRIEMEEKRRQILLQDEEEHTKYIRNNLFKIKVGHPRQNSTSRSIQHI